MTTRGMSFVRAVSTEGFGRLKYQKAIRKRWTRTDNSCSILNRRPLNFRSSTLTWHEKIWGRCGSRFRKGRCITIPMHIPTLRGAGQPQTALSSYRRAACRCRDAAILTAWHARQHDVGLLLLYADRHTRSVAQAPGLRMSNNISRNPQRRNISSVDRSYELYVTAGTLWIHHLVGDGSGGKGVLRGVSESGD
jgi:hypothetical protein